MHNLNTVISFEVVRTLKKKTFWVTALSFPVVITVVFAIIFFSNQATEQATLDTQNQKFSLAITDESNAITPQLITQLGAKTLTDKQQGIQQVKDGSLDAYFYYPSELDKQKVEVYAKDVGLFDNSRYQGTADALLNQSIATTVDTETVAILKNKVDFSSVTFKDGIEYDGFKQLIAPGLFLVLFYILVTMFGSQMLTSTTEEKENRVIEMLLTTIKARTLIIGKILSLIILALIQIVIILIPILVIYLQFGDVLALPNIDLANLPLDPVRITVGAIIFALSFLLFTGLLVAIGSAVPTAREASGFFGLIMMLIFGPLYAFTLFISAPHSSIVTFLSYFPLTAPIPLMLRNAVGNLTIPEALIGIAVLGVSAAIVLAIAIRMFRYGALEYSKILSLKSIFATKKNTPRR
ncbi:MAG: putative transporter permease protein [Candidatus Saccharibacteria bacterium]|jgi:ABC-2 type transport system permease protein|nr:putative transporter permease protein [Candidatus Saccharibacteria bacterium]